MILMSSKQSPWRQRSISKAKTSNWALGCMLIDCIASISICTLHTGSSTKQGYLCKSEWAISIIEFTLKHQCCFLFSGLSIWSTLHEWHQWWPSSLQIQETQEEEGDFFYSPCETLDIIFLIKLRQNYVSTIQSGQGLFRWTRWPVMEWSSVMTGNETRSIR